MSHCIPLPIISCTKAPKSLQSPCNSHIPVPATAFGDLQSDIQMMSLFPSDLWSKQNRKQSPRKPLDRMLQTRSTLFLLPQGRSWELETSHQCYMMPGRGEARVNRNTMKFPTILSVAFSWFGIHFVAANPWLASKSPTKLFRPIYCPSSVSM